MRAHVPDGAPFFESSVSDAIICYDAIWIAITQRLEWRSDYDDKVVQNDAIVARIRAAIERSNPLDIPRGFCCQKVRDHTVVSTTELNATITIVSVQPLVAVVTSGRTNFRPGIDAKHADVAENDAPPRRMRSVEYVGSCIRAGQRGPRADRMWWLAPGRAGAPDRWQPIDTPLNRRFFAEKCDYRMDDLDEQRWQVRSFAP